jgi:hypothetical protein
VTGVFTSAATDFGGIGTAMATDVPDDDAGGLEGEVVAARPSRRRSLRRSSARASSRKNSLGGASGSWNGIAVLLSVDGDEVFNRERSDPGPERHLMRRFAAH